MEQGHLRQLPGRTGQQARKVLGNLDLCVPDGGHVSDGLAGVVRNEEAARCGVVGDPHVAWPWELSRPRPGRPRVVVAGGVDYGDPVICQTPDVLEKEAFGLEGKAVAVEEVAGDEKGVDVFADRYVDSPSEGLPRRVAQLPPNGPGTAGERGIEVRVGDVQETHDGR